MIAPRALIPSAPSPCWTEADPLSTSVTRDLSRVKRAMILPWLDNLVR
jgi:hypothetical protein